MSSVARIDQVPEIETKRLIEGATEFMADLPQTSCPLVHRFAPGVYLREIHMPADTVVIGKKHLTEHFNIIMKGRCLLVAPDGSREEIHAPHVFVSGVGVQKVLYILEDTVWLTVHPTTETSISRLENNLVEPLPAHIQEKLCRSSLSLSAPVP